MVAPLVSGEPKTFPELEPIESCRLLLTFCMTTSESHGPSLERWAAQTFSCELQSKTIFGSSGDPTTFGAGVRKGTLQLCPGTRCSARNPDAAAMFWQLALSSVTVDLKGRASNPNFQVDLVQMRACAREKAH